MRKELFEKMIKVVEHYEAAKDCNEKEQIANEQNNALEQKYLEDGQYHWEQYERLTEDFVEAFIDYYGGALEDYDGSSTPKGKQV